MAAKQALGLKQGAAAAAPAANRELGLPAARRPSPREARASHADRFDRDGRGTARSESAESRRREAVGDGVDVDRHRLSRVESSAQIVGASGLKGKTRHCGLVSVMAQLAPPSSPPPPTATHASRSRTCAMNSRGRKCRGRSQALEGVKNAALEFLDRFELRRGAAMSATKTMDAPKASGRRRHDRGSPSGHDHVGGACSPGEAAKATARRDCHALTAVSPRPVPRATARAHRTGAAHGGIAVRETARA